MLNMGSKNIRVEYNLRNKGIKKVNGDDIFDDISKNNTNLL